MKRNSPTIAPWLNSLAMSASDPSGDVIVEGPEPCASCGEAAHIVMKDGRRLCAHCFREEKRPAAESVS